MGKPFLYLFGRERSEKAGVADPFPLFIGLSVQKPTFATRLQVISQSKTLRRPKRAPRVRS